MDKTQLHFIFGAIILNMILLGFLGHFILGDLKEILEILKALKP